MSIAETIRDQVKEWDCPAWEINQGECDTFADELYSKLSVSGMNPEVRDTCGMALELEALPGHVWLEISGMHYDAECPEGVEDWRELPIFQRRRKEI